MPGTGTEAASVAETTVAGLDYMGRLPHRIGVAGLIQRRMQSRDRELYCALHRDPEVMCNIGPALSRERACRGFDAVMDQLDRSPPHSMYWVIEVWERAVGIMALVPGDDVLPELGTLLLPAAQGQGLTVRAITALADACLAPGGAPGLRARHRDGHPAVPRVLSRLGFQCDGSVAGITSWRMSAGRWRECSGADVL